MARGDMALRIEDYGIIGNTHTAALVGKNGSIDWLCLPRFDSSACFAALLGNSDNGHWQIAPRNHYKSRRRYLDGTLVLQTDFQTHDGLVSVKDCMLMGRDNPTVVRVVEGVEGQVDMHMQIVLRFDYGSEIPWVQKIPGVGISAVAGPDSIRFQSPVPLRGENFRTLADFRVHRGDRYAFVMTWHASHLSPPPDIADPVRAMQETEEEWTRWSRKSIYRGRWKEAVTRSLITLRSLVYAPTGGMVAAVTSSLPEDLGGSRNWDYRFCWLRDATLTLYSLIVAGYFEEAHAWRRWLLRAVAGKPSQIAIMYGVAGERRVEESTIDWLSGYEGSPPVRMGNAAYKQFQLDVFGEVMDALHVARRSDLNCDVMTWNLERALLEYLEHEWHRPDRGIWEIRGEPRHFTHSKVMAWVALDRAIKDIDRFNLPGPVDRWKEVQKKMHDEICEKGFNGQLNSFVQYYGGEHLDASLLMLPLVGFLPANDPRMVGTVHAIENNLMRGGLVRRYLQEKNDVDGLPGGEGTFIACSFWLADNYVLQGRKEEAERLFENLLSLRNDLGLLSEEYDVREKRLTGNFPQAFSHVSLINSARNISGTGGPVDHRLSKGSKHL